MKSLGGLLELLQTWIEDVSIDDSLSVFLNFAIEEAEELVDWSALYGEETLTSTSDGILTMPPQARKILHIFAATTTNGLPAYEFYPRDTEPTAETGGLIGYRMSPYLAVSTPLGTGTGAVTQGSATITGTGFSTTWEDERIQIGETQDLYKITAASTTELTLSSPVPHASESYALTIRPVGTERFLLTNKLEEPFEGDVIVKYQKKHPSLVSDTDRLIIKCAHTVALLGLQNSLITDKYSVDAQRLDNALLIAKNREIANHPFHKTKQVRRDGLFAVKSNRQYDPRRRR